MLNNEVTVIRISKLPVFPAQVAMEDRRGKAKITPFGDRVNAMPGIRVDFYAGSHTCISEYRFDNWEEAFTFLTDCSKACTLCPTADHSLPVPPEHTPGK